MPIFDAILDHKVLGRFGHAPSRAEVRLNSMPGEEPGATGDRLIEARGIDDLPQ